MKKSVIIGSVVGLIGLVAILFLVYISIHNREAELRNLIKAQQSINKDNFDKMFKSIKQVADVAKANLELNKEAFKEIYPDLMEARYSAERGGALMSWITESNPQFDMSATSKLFERLQVSIEANRRDFFNEQKKLEDYAREHRNLIMKFPGSLFYSLSDTIEIVKVTSAKTKEVFRSGEDNDIDLFKK